MSLKSFLAKPYAKILVGKQTRDGQHAVELQEILLKQMVAFAKDTYFGKAHDFDKIDSIQAFQDKVPIRDYEQAKTYFDLTAEGKKDILWPGRPIYFAKTSGTTSGTKYISITKESIANHINGAKMALLTRINTTGNAHFVDGKMIFLSGSPELTETSDILTGRLSGIVNHHIPNYLQKNQVPSWQTNCIDDWETKVEAIVEETKDLDMSLISGIPPWVIMYFERLLERTGKPTVKEVFPNFDVFVYGGVNYKPYQAKIDQLIGGPVQMIETYPASEGFMAFQDEVDDTGLLLNINSGIFYEFVPVDNLYDARPPRLTLSEVELGVNYAIILTTNAGLWAYNIGDTVKFVSKDPYRIVVTGRTKHFISAFGEHVIAEEVEQAMQYAINQTEAVVSDFHVAPQVNVSEGLPYHEWFVAFDQTPDNMARFSQLIDERLVDLNSYYADLRKGNMLQSAIIRPLPSDAFEQYMKSIGKLGGQNKLPRLSNNRKIANQLL